MKYVIAAALTLSLIAPSARAAGDPAAAAKHIAAAKALAGEEFKNSIFWICTPGVTLDYPHPMPTPPPTRIFDNVYFVGTGYESAFAITTSDGIILLNALENPEQAQTNIEGGIKALGLDPAAIKYIIISHGHPGHFGGARYFQDKYPGVHVLMSAADYDLAESRAKAPTGTTPRRTDAKTPIPPAPRRDMVITDGQKLTLGDVTIPLYLTPGHTPGTVSMFIPVKDHGKPHVISFNGGSTFPHTSKELIDYQNSLARFTALGREAGADSIVAHQSMWDETIEKIAALRKNPDGPNPFLMTRAAMDRYFKVHEECLRASAAQQVGLELP